MTNIPRDYPMGDSAASHEGRCVDCDGVLPDKTDPCPSCGELVCEKCFDGMQGMCLACPKRAREQSVLNHEGQEIKVPSFGCDDVMEDLEQPVTYRLLAAKLAEIEKRVRQEHAAKRAAFEERLTQQFEERWSEGVRQIAGLVNKEALL